MKPLRSLAFWTLAFLSFGSAWAGRPADLETVGMKIGQSEAEVTAAMKAFDAGMKIQQVRWQDQPYLPGSLSALYGSTPAVLPFREMAEYGEYLQATFGQATRKAYFVVRRSGPLTKTKITTEALLDALIKKYGEPTERSEQKETGLIRLHWTYKKDGSPAPSALCQHPDFSNFFVSELMNTTAREECGITAMASIAGLPGRPVLRTYQIAIFSHQDYLDDVKVRRELADDWARDKNERDKGRAKDAPRI